MVEAELLKATSTAVSCVLAFLRFTKGLTIGVFQRAPRHAPFPVLFVHHPPSIEDAGTNEHSDSWHATSSHGVRLTVTGNPKGAKQVFSNST